MDWVQYVVTIVCALLASSGFWGYISRKADQRHDEEIAHQKQAQAEREAQKRLLIGLAHDRIMQLGVKYINRGYISHEEYENFIVYLYEPYSACGGNGSGAKIAEEVKKLPMNNSKSQFY